MTHFEWNWTQDGTKFFAEGWSPAQPKAVICLVHGFAEYSGRYERVAERLGRDGYAVLAFDQFGHGKTEGPRGYSPSLEASLDSIQLILDEAKKRYLGLPLFLYGHSMGGNMVLNFILRRHPKLNGVVVTAPWMLLGFDPPKFKLMLASVMKNIYPKFAEKADLDTSFISRDKEEVRKYDTDPLIHNTARAGTFFETYNAGKWAMENADKLTLPLLIMHGTADKIISHTGSENFVAHAPLHLVTFKSYEGYYHEIHNEPAADRERVFHDMSHWLDKHLTTATA